MMFKSRVSGSVANVSR